MEFQQPNQLSRDFLLKRRKYLDDLIKRKFIYNIGFDIYGGTAGLFDYGPIGCAIKQNIEQTWREHFVLEEDMLEINATCLTPEIVLKASGHVDRFSDYIVRDKKTNAGFRADKLLIEFLEKLIDKTKAPEKIHELKQILNHAETYSKTEMAEVLKKLNVRSPDTGNELTDPEDFNLMFGTQIGPTGVFPGFLRPETAQGIFVNFQKLLDFNGGRMPFASAQIGLGFRNEIAPRAGILRVREFQMAEIEHFVDPTNKHHPKFSSYQHHKLPLFSQEQQEKMEEPLRNITLGQAVGQKIIGNETLAYFMCRTFLFLVKVGVNPNNIRFRQHKKDEMAHYASDCWDAEIEISYGWTECVGIADRACFDLTNHAKFSKTTLQAARRLEKPIMVKILEVEPNKQKLGKEFKSESKAILSILECLDEEGKKNLKDQIEKEGKADINVETKTYSLSKEYFNFKEEEKIVNEEKFVPHVIEPSFGISRILYSVLEHSFRMRDEKRTFLALPPWIAPVKCSILTVIALPEFEPFTKALQNNLKRNGVSNKVDVGGSTIGRRYARTDEIGIPFGITVDKLTLTDKSVTLREAVTMKQIRISIEEVVKTVSDLTEGHLSWEDVLKKYPLFEAKEEDEEEKNNKE